MLKVIQVIGRFFFVFFKIKTHNNGRPDPTRSQVKLIDRGQQEFHPP
jgi:hypothetical protein